MQGKKLSPRQTKFIEEYLLCLNGTEAAKRAGYSEKTANEQAAQLLAKLSIREAVEEGLKKRKEKFELSEQKIIDELSTIAFGNIGNVMEWEKHSMSFIPKRDLTAKEMAFIDSITESETESGRTLKMTTLAGQKIKALELLGKHIGMWKDALRQPTGHDPLDVIHARLRERLRRSGTGGGTPSGSGTPQSKDG